MFSKNTDDEARAAVMEALQINSEARNEKYLGLPVTSLHESIQFPNLFILEG
jgi:hypothetical protein